ncbi:hypothetical protein CTAYLR_007430 [Chrysophaeum taylorii]|uniref:Sulfite oxidase n=1 Tax=Chrysophaeum taylorii TaxID=2483200 RepID=A0AAD7XJI7_9STRA|nr:hypothetical protein CTAYLR_007430 [Chrysophaeum taylorii]
MRLASILRRRIVARPRVAARAVGAALATHDLSAAALAAVMLLGTSALCEDEEPGSVRPELPTVGLSEVRKHVSREKGIWVVYKRGVYDITEFCARHPGGTKILLAAGKSIEPFWQLFAAHHRADVYEMLEECRIGNLDEVGAAELAATAPPHSDAYANDPDRSPALRVNSTEPFNAEPPSELLMNDFVTPNDLFFVRNHLPVPPPVEDPSAWHLKICARGPSVCHHVSMDDLKRTFDKATVTATLQCAGNRRREMAGVKAVKGLSWDKTAIGTARWSGARLADVLRAHGVDDAMRHVQFEGRDADATGERYGASIPLATALDPRKDVLLAYEMNGRDIPRDHGHPLRVIVPGTVGARQVKYLDKIICANTESPSFWQTRDYKGFPPNVDYSTTDYWSRAGPSVQELPVQSAITEPAADTPVDVDDTITIRGYAWSGGGRGIVRVDVSLDDGHTWTQADLDPRATAQEYNRSWAWTPWELTVDVPDNATTLTLVCKAVDSSYNAQPESVAPIWNMRGILNNAYHRVTVHLLRPQTDDDDDEEEEEEEEDHFAHLASSSSTFSDRAPTRVAGRIATFPQKQQQQQQQQQQHTP